METKESTKIANRSYGCPVEKTLEVVSGKWKCVILWWLRQGEKRFSEILLLIPAITNKVLTQQLRELESDDLIRRETYGERPPRVEYFLTKKGRSLQPLVELMCDWGKGQLSGFEFGILKLAGLKVLAVSATQPTAEALHTVLAETCGAELVMRSQATPLETILETHIQVEPEVVIVEFSDTTPDFRRLIQQVKQMEREQETSVVTIGLTHNSAERSQAFAQKFRLALSNPFEMDELVGAIASLTDRLG
ncbi:MAG: helix-turn-helix domain-containing protein [Cyanobacteria bacterium P01_F01_bin.53]